MQRIAHRLWSALPSKIIAGFGWVFMFYATVQPTKAREWMDWLMTPDQVEFWGYMGLAVFSAYWLILWFLKPREGGTSNGGLTQTSSGPNSPNFNAGTIGDVHIHPPAPAPAAKQAPRPAEPYSPPPASRSAGSGWTNEKLDGLERAMLGVSPPANAKPDLMLSKIFPRVYKKVRSENPNREFSKLALINRVDLEIGDIVKLHELTVWGRWGNRPIEIIPRAYLNKGEFKHKNEQFITPTIDTVRWSVYTDIKLNRAEIEAKWPKQ